MRKRSLKRHRHKWLILAINCTMKCSNKRQFFHVSLPDFLHKADPQNIVFKQQFTCCNKIRWENRQAIWYPGQRGVGPKANIFIMKACKAFSRWAESHTVCYPRTFSSSEMTKLCSESSDHSLSEKLESSVWNLYMNLFSHSEFMIRTVYTCSLS